MSNLEIVNFWKCSYQLSPQEFYKISLFTKEGNIMEGIKVIHNQPQSVQPSILKTKLSIWVGFIWFTVDKVKESNII